MNDILISIIIATYNRADILSQTLDSVLRQTYVNWECIVVDDGSTDNTDQLLTEYCKQDMRFKYHKRPKEKPKGGNVCRNLGFELSSGLFIKWLDSDDLLSNDLLLSQVNLMTTSIEDKYIVATSKWNYFTDNIENVTPKVKEINKNYDNGFDLIYDFGVYNTFLPPHAYLVRREVIMKSGLWNESLLINQDGEFFTRVLLNTSKVLHAQNGTAFYRYGLLNDNVSTFSNEQKCRDAILSWILIDTYIKIHIKQENSIKYVENGKQYLLKNISNKDLRHQYLFFLGKTLQEKNLYEQIIFIFNFIKVSVARRRKLK